jgi:hypothetical protein
MANPIKVDVPKNTWTKVATNVTAGVIKIRDYQSSDYFSTYRMTGNPAPTGDQTETTSTQIKSPEMIISATAGIDVYLYCYEKDGSVVVAI